MEIRANYVLVGVFCIAMLAGALAFGVWTAGKHEDVPMSRYEISFTESVRGLSVNSGVLFTGIRVGRVEQIKISEVTPGAVRVRIAVASDTPVREDSEAQIAVMGLTGASQITISGGTASSPLVRLAEGEVGTIRYLPSPLSQVPDMVASVNHLLQRADGMFSERNVQAVETILHSLATLSATLARRSQEIDAALLSFANSARKLEQIMANADRILATDLTATSASLNRIAKRMDATLTAIEPGLKQFSTQGFAEMRMLMTEARNLVHVLTRVGQKLESDPRRFFFGESSKEYRNQ